MAAQCSSHFLVQNLVQLCQFFLSLRLNLHLGEVNNLVLAFEFLDLGLFLPVDFLLGKWCHIIISTLFRKVD